MWPQQLAPIWIMSKCKQADGWTYYLAEGAMKNSLVGKDNEVVGRLKGSDLVGWEYAVHLTNCQSFAKHLQKRIMSIA